LCFNSTEGENGKEKSQKMVKDMVKGWENFIGEVKERMRLGNVKEVRRE